MCDEGSQYDSDDGLEVTYAATVHAEHVAGYHDLHNSNNQNNNSISLKNTHQNFNIKQKEYQQYDDGTLEVSSLLRSRGSASTSSNSVSRPNRPSSLPLDPNLNILESETYEEHYEEQENHIQFTYNDPPPQPIMVPIKKSSMKELFKMNHSLSKNEKMKKREIIDIQKQKSNHVGKRIKTNVNTVSSGQNSSSSSLDRPMSWKNGGSMFNASSNGPPNFSNKKSITSGRSLKKNNNDKKKSYSSNTSHNSSFDRISSKEKSSVSNRPSFPPSSLQEKMKLSGAMFATPMIMKKCENQTNHPNTSTSSSASTSTSSSSASSSSASSSASSHSIVNSNHSKLLYSECSSPHHDTIVRLPFTQEQSKVLITHEEEGGEDGLINSSHDESTTPSINNHKTIHSKRSSKEMKEKGGSSSSSNGGLYATAGKKFMASSRNHLKHMSHSISSNEESANTPMKWGNASGIFKPLIHDELDCEGDGKRKKTFARTNQGPLMKQLQGIRKHDEGEVARLRSGHFNMKDMLSDKIWMELIIESKFIGATVEEESENNGNGMRTFIATIQNIHFPLNSDTAAAASTTTSVTTSLCNEDKVSDEDKVVSSEKLDDKQLWLNLALPSTTHIQGYESLIGASVNVVFSLATLRHLSVEKGSEIRIFDPITIAPPSSKIPSPVPLFLSNHSPNSLIRKSDDEQCTKLPIVLCTQLAIMSKSKKNLTASSSTPPSQA